MEVSDPGLVAPVVYPPRDFRKNGQASGNIWNPPAFAEMGGLTGPSKIENQGFSVEKPTSAKPATQKARKI